MRRFAFSLLAALFFTTPAFTAAPQVPRKAGEFVIRMPDNKQLLLSSYRGKVVVLAFMFTTCPHCQKMAGILAQVQKEYADKGVQILGATFDPNAQFQVQKFVQVFGVNFPCGYSDLKSVMDFEQVTNPPFVPDLIFIDKAGTIRSQYVPDGTDPAPEKFISAPDVNIRAELNRMLKARPASAPVRGATHKTPDLD